MRRRCFLIFSVSALYFPFTGVEIAPFKAMSKNDLLVTRQVARSLIFNLDFAYYIGRVYVEQNANEVDLDNLATQLGLTRGTVSNKKKAEFKERFRTEFKCGETLTIDGWILARSEVYLYAMLALQT